MRQRACFFGVLAVSAFLFTLNGQAATPDYFVTGEATPRAMNSAHGFVTSFENGSFTVQPNEAGPQSWNWGLSLVAWGRPSHLQPVEAASLTMRENRIEMHRGSLREWYINSPEGIEQGFTIPAPPDRAHGKLVLDFRLEGTLRPSFAIDGQAIDFADAGSISVLHYAKLFVTDSANRKLAAGFEAIAGGVRIAIDDAEAVYPLTIDPIATSPAWAQSGNFDGAQYGHKVATAGDVNGDGYADILVSAKAAQARVFLYLGSASGLAESDTWTATGEQSGSRFGYTIASAGDVNGDGYSDVIVGASSYDGGGADRGRVYLYLGSASGLQASAAWTATGNNDGGELGASVASAGDVNNDGYSDVIVGAPFHDAAGFDRGRAYLYLGSSNGLAATPAWTSSGDEDLAEYGGAVATAGDVNGDGYSDVIVAAPSRDAGGPDRGRAYLYRGMATGLATVPARILSGDKDGARFGSSVATAGDVNGDGYADVIVGAASHDAGGSDRVRVYLYLGSSAGLAASASWVASGDMDGAMLGSSVATAGDANGDGYADVIIGAPLHNGGGFSSGRAYLYLGSASSLSASHAWAHSGPWYSQFGISVDTAGDVNGDGSSDLLVGAPTEAGFIRGIACVFHGSGTPGCFDQDGDGYGQGDVACLSPIPDCNDLNPNAWDAPGETRNLLFTSKTTLTWDIPDHPGAPAAALIQSVTRSTDASNFSAFVYTCINAIGTTATDETSPSIGQVFFYLSRVRNSCPTGMSIGTLGYNSQGQERIGNGCTGAP